MALFHDSAEGDDDYSRLAYAAVHPSENTVFAVRFFRRAPRGFEGLGVRCKRVLTDNAKSYSSKAFTALCEEAGVRQGLPYRTSALQRPRRAIGKIPPIGSEHHVSDLMRSHR